MLFLRNLKSRFLFWRGKKPSPSPLHEIYKDKQGNKWYALKNPAHISAERALTAWAYMEDSKYSLSRENLRTLLDAINGAINRNDIATIAKVTGVIEATQELYCNEEILLNLASVYCFINDEKNDGTIDYIQEQKRKVWQEDADCKSFFLQFAWQYTQRYSELPQLNVTEYLGKVKPVIENIAYHLQKVKLPKNG